MKLFFYIPIEKKTINFYFSNNFDVDFLKIWDYENSIEQYDIIGGTAKSRVLEQIKSLQNWLHNDAK